jgi:hypothetical protein
MLGPCFGFIVALVVGDLDARTTPWPTYASCAQDMMPVGRPPRRFPLLGELPPDTEREPWRPNWRHCIVTKDLRYGDTLFDPEIFGTRDLWHGTISLDLEELLKVQKFIPLLRDCEKFSQCLSDRDEGKVKHCYWPRSLRQYDASSKDPG